MLWDRFWFNHRCKFIVNELGESIHEDNRLPHWEFKHDRVTITKSIIYESIEIKLDDQIVYDHWMWEVDRSCQHKFIGFVKKWNIIAHEHKVERRKQEKCAREQALQNRNKLCKDWE